MGICNKCERLYFLDGHFRKKEKKESAAAVRKMRSPYPRRQLEKRKSPIFKMTF